MIESLVLLILLAPAVPDPPTRESPVVMATHTLAPQGQSSITGFVFDQSRRPHKLCVRSGLAPLTWGSGMKEPTRP